MEKYVHYYKVKGFKIEPGANYDLSLDGERIPSAALTCEITDDNATVLTLRKGMYESPKLIYHS